MQHQPHSSFIFNLTDKEKSIAMYESYVQFKVEELVVHGGHSHSSARRIYSNCCNAQGLSIVMTKRTQRSALLISFLFISFLGLLHVCKAVAWAVCLTISDFAIRLLGFCNYTTETDRTIPGSMTRAAFTKVTTVEKTLLTLAALCAFLPIAATAPVTVELTQFTSGIGARFIGPYDARTGSDVVQIGDHNGDGFTDYMVGAVHLNTAVIVMKKGTANTEINMATVVSGQYFRVIKGPASSNTGASLGGIGDINGDSFDDVIIGASAGTITGRGIVGYAFVIFGKVGPFTDIAMTATWSVPSIGFMILGPVIDAAFVGIPRNARGLGDVNGDGVDDFAVSARQYPSVAGKENAGAVWVIFGKKTPAFTNIDLLPANFGTNGIVYRGESEGDFFGWSVMPAGDFNHDGIADFLIGSPTYNVGGTVRYAAGAVFLLYGSATELATTDMSTFVTGTKGVRFLGAVAGDSLGQGTGGVGDINGDGIDDIAIGAPLADPLQRSSGGIVYVIYGNTNTYSADVDLLDFTASLQGFAVYGRANNMQLCTVAPAGDVNTDGVNDILLGGCGAHSRAHIVYGQLEERTVPVDTLTAEVMTFFYTVNARLGTSLDGGKDLNNDGIPDILLGAYVATTTPAGGGTAVSLSGAAWMLPGPFILPSNAPTIAPTSGGSPVPTPGPTDAPSVTPSLTPSFEPSIAPTFTVTEVPSTSPSDSPTVQPSATPTVIPSYAPSVLPSAAPSADPTAPPSAFPTSDESSAPTVQPSQVPTATPSTENPSVKPSKNPSCLPSMSPTSAPTRQPTMPPSFSPTLLPTESPTTPPSVSPSVTPSVTPTQAPSLIPTSEPTIAPTAAPSIVPTLVPSASPSAAPTAQPTTHPSFFPTSSPTPVITVAPTMVPSARPTADAYQIQLGVVQTVYNVSKADCEAQRSTCNRTIQHTVADMTGGVTPERVTDIIVEEEEEEGRIGNMRALATAGTPRVLLKYKVNVYDPLLTFEVLTAQLKAKVASKEFDVVFHSFALLFNATRLASARFGEPRVTFLSQSSGEKDTSEEVNIALIVGVVVGGLLFLSIVALGVRAIRHRKRNYAAAVAIGG